MSIASEEKLQKMSSIFAQFFDLFPTLYNGVIQRVRISIVTFLCYQIYRKRTGVVTNELEKIHMQNNSYTNPIHVHICLGFPSSEAKANTPALWKKNLLRDNQVHLTSAFLLSYHLYITLSESRVPISLICALCLFLFQ